MILANGCNITKSEKFKGVWILSIPTVCVNDDRPVTLVCVCVCLSVCVCVCVCVRACMRVWSQIWSRSLTVWTRLLQTVLWSETLQIISPTRTWTRPSVFWLAWRDRCCSRWVKGETPDCFQTGSCLTPQTWCTMSVWRGQRSGCGVLETCLETDDTCPDRQTVVCLIQLVSSLQTLL